MRPKTRPLMAWKCVLLASPTQDAHILTLVFWFAWMCNTLSCAPLEYFLLMLMMMHYFRRSGCFFTWAMHTVTVDFQALEHTERKKKKPVMGKSGKGEGTLIFTRSLFCAWFFFALLCGTPHKTEILTWKKGIPSTNGKPVSAWKLYYFPRVPFLKLYSHPSSFFLFCCRHIVGASQFRVRPAMKNLSLLHLSK